MNLVLSEEEMKALERGVPTASFAYKKGFTTLIGGEKFVIAGSPAASAWKPKGGSTSYLLVYKKANPNKVYRLDWDELKEGPMKGSQGWEHNQKGVKEVLNLEITNHQPAGRIASVTGSTLRIFKFFGRAMFVIAVIDSLVQIYYAKDRWKEVIVQSAGWTAAWAGARLGGSVGAEGGAEVGVWFDGVGAIPGGLIGGLGGSLVGGATGYFYGTKVTRKFFELTELSSEEWIIVDQSPQN